MIKIRITAGENGKDILPISLEDNYFSLMPEVESRVIKFHFVNKSYNHPHFKNFEPYAYVDCFNCDIYKD